MTTIAYSKKFGIMAGDKQASIENSKHGVMTKVFKIEDRLIGFSGCSDVAVALLRWVKNDFKDESWPELQYENHDCNVLLVEPSGVVKMYERYPIPIVLEQEIHAIGSGRDFALATMYLGHDPVKAIEVASALDGYTGSGIDVVSLGSANQ